MIITVLCSREKRFAIYERMVEDIYRVWIDRVTELESSVEERKFEE